MARKSGQSRYQYGLFATPLDDLIAEDNPVRVIDAFVDAMDLASFGFRAVRDNRMGAASYDPATLLKIYFYGYFNRIRSSRCLERECARNVEMMWLVDRLTPSYHTISTFRTLKEKDDEGKALFNHRTALQKVFHAFNRFLKGEDLFGLTTFAVDGTKIAAQNSKKRHISGDKIARKLERVDDRIGEYLDALDEMDVRDEDLFLDAASRDVVGAIGELLERKDQLLRHKQLLEQAQAQDPSITQIALTDPDARMLPINNEGMMVLAYNVQSVVDDKHCLIADFSVENQKDLYLLAQMGESVKERLGIPMETPIELLADKGYHSAQGLHDCEESNITTYVAFPEKSFKDKPKGFQKKDFRYDAQADEFTCPNNQKLRTSGTWHDKKGRQGHAQPRYKLYRCPFSICSGCPFKDKCLSVTNMEQRHGRTMERGEFDGSVEANRRRILANRDKYKRRQAIVEHPFGTIKRSWGAYYTLLKGKEKVGGEMAVVFTVYNLRRVINIIGAKTLISRLKRRFPAKNAPSRPMSGRFFKIGSPAAIKIDRRSLDLVACRAAA